MRDAAGDLKKKKNLSEKSGDGGGKAEEKMDRAGDADWCSCLLPEGSTEVERWRLSPEKRKWPHAGWSFWGRVACPCLPCPQRGPRRTFWSAWPPRRQPQNWPPLNFHAMGWKLFNIYIPIDVYFLREKLPRIIVMPHTASGGNILSGARFVRWPSLLCSNLTL